MDGLEDALHIFSSSREFKGIFALVFAIYFLFFQWADRLLLFTHIRFPAGVSLVVDTSPPVPPSQMPFPLWGPFLSLTSPYFDWAMTPLSIGISFLLSFLVATNVTLYVIYFAIIRKGAKVGLAASLGVLATSLSCSCELFTGIIGSVASNLPFLGSIAFMTSLDEGLVALATMLLSASTVVLYEEIGGGKPLHFLSLHRHAFQLGGLVGLSLALLALPEGFPLSLVRLATSVALGGTIGALLGRTWRWGLLASILLGSLTLALFPRLYVGPLLDLAGVSVGLLGYLGYSSMRRWAQLGLLHVIAWSLIMPGPISLVLGSPVGFFSFPTGELVEFWISAWIIGTPIAWGAGIGLLQYIRDNMAEVRTLRLPPSSSTGRGGATWIGLGLVAVVSQVIFFLTHSEYFIDYNGYDSTFLTIMTLTSTSTAAAGAIAIGYGILTELRKRRLKLRRKDLLLALPLSILYAVLGGAIHLEASGYPYSFITIGTYGAPMMAPWVNLYLPGVIGVFLYPLQLLQLIGVSLLSAALLSTALRAGRKRVIPSLALGSLAVCPACVLSPFVLTVLWSSVLGSLATTAEGQIGISLASDGVLLAVLIYVSRKTTCSPSQELGGNK
ncbi:hypothetical protein HS1genome_0597 [Sulfodiicoccus acidiphilus]|uniref:Uncharacterized protein n=1 Tax=Sulfodiicoccus acidiphilus TaxID=1670455 RepID=A0A348B206_9CREN|nr:hypothetical protein [Sulfodiicoccus acidiphilus]BBD72208.1 hypothetical protein HS1genome_0597 [Sulfodiicoccus acidiphilus]GGU03033.1 hypothetical protein GCM10007116_20060 [Sulfodiicoccus acidiphilus]